MFTAHRQRRFVTWLALSAMLVMALVPTISRAMAYASGSSNWAEICTPQGLKAVSVDDTDRGTSSTPAQAGSHLDPCAFCALATDGAAPLPATLRPSLLPVGSAEPPRLFLQATRTLHAWRAAQPRGPPAHA